MNEKERIAKRFAVHDIVFLRDEDAFIGSVTPQPWVEEALKDTLAAVVRRGPRPGALIPVSVRGREYTQRCAGFVSSAAISKSIKPEHLVERRAWRTHRRHDQVASFRQLEMLTDVWASSGLVWGPVGIIGFELATKYPVTGKNDDLDILIRAEARISFEEAKAYWDAAASAEVHVDIQLETPQGGISLIDYLRRPPKVLVQTDAGPKLVRDPWEDLSSLE